VKHTLIDIEFYIADTFACLFSEFKPHTASM